jgi:hypothetical protein
MEYWFQFQCGSIKSVVPDNIGNNRIVGEKGRGASLTVTEQTNDKPGYAIKLEWDCFEPPLFYTGAFA